MFIIFFVFIQTPKFNVIVIIQKKIEINVNNLILKS